MISFDSKTSLPAAWFPFWSQIAILRKSVEFATTLYRLCDRILVQNTVPFYTFVLYAYRNCAQKYHVIKLALERYFTVQKCPF